MLTGREVAKQMRDIEDNIETEIGESSPALDRCVAVLLDLEYEGLDVTLAAEAQRVIQLQAEWYMHFGVEYSQLNAAALGFVQGITFAVAAQRLRDSQ